MPDDLASQFKKHLEEEDDVERNKKRLIGIWVMIVRILIIIN
jgi:hypothetical protein